MQVLRQDIDTDEFFERVGSAQSRGLLLDYDGTLAPFRAERTQALPYSEVIEPLNRIRRETDTRVALISGRTIADLMPLIAALRPMPELWGSHGWERLDSRGRHISVPPPPAVAVLLENARRTAAERGFLQFCEIKAPSVALHWRGLPEETKARLRRAAEEAWRPLVDQAGPGAMELHEFDGGLEFRAVGRNKGAAVGDIAAELTFDAAIAYLGDDQTDEDAFAALSHRGLCALVRPKLRPTRAHVWIAPPHELVEFLTRWLDSCKSQRCHVNDPV